MEKFADSLQIFFATISAIFIIFLCPPPACIFFHGTDSYPQFIFFSWETPHTYFLDTLVKFRGPEQINKQQLENGKIYVLSICLYPLVTISNITVTGLPNEYKISLPYWDPCKGSNLFKRWGRIESRRYLNLPT